MRALRRGRRSRTRRSTARSAPNTGIRVGAGGGGLRGARAALCPAPPAGEPARELKKPKTCYVCKAEFTRLHLFYDAMCPDCAELNYAKRFQTASLDGPRGPGHRRAGEDRLPDRAQDAARRRARDRHHALPARRRRALLARARLRGVEGPPPRPRPRPAPRAERRDLRALPRAAPSSASTSSSTTPARRCAGRPGSTRTCSTERGLGSTMRRASPACSPATKARRRGSVKRPPSPAAAPRPMRRAWSPGAATAAASGITASAALSQVRYAFDDAGACVATSSPRARSTPTSSRSTCARRTPGA